MPRCLVSLGSNLGDTDAALDAAELGLRQLAEHDSLRISTRHRTTPVGGPAGQNGFLNAAAVFKVSVAPAELLEALQRIEVDHDRRRGVRWAARTLDLDLLLYDEDVVSTPDLRVPHPRMTFRPFVLRPVCEIAAEWRHPECDQTLADLWDILRWGTAAASVLHDTTGEISRWINESHPRVRLESSASVTTNQLTIDASPVPSTRGPFGPRLVLADCPREHWRDEVVAALECVWPTSP